MLENPPASYDPDPRERKGLLGSCAGDPAGKKTEPTEQNDQLKSSGMGELYHARAILRPLGISKKGGGNLNTLKNDSPHIIHLPFPNAELGREAGLRSSKTRPLR